MKAFFVFALGCIVGGFIIWYGLTRQIVLLPSGTTMIEVNRFTGTARELHYSYEEANRLRLEEDVRVEKSDEEWKLKHNPPAPPEGEREKPSPSVELTPEELAQITFVASIPQNASYLDCRFYNGTKKSLVSAEIRVEGQDKTTGMSIGRRLTVRFGLAPACDTQTSVELSGGAISNESRSDLKITLVKVLAAAAEK